MKTALVGERNKAQRIDIQFELAYEFIVIDLIKALEYADESYSNSEELGDSLRMVRAGRMRASALRRMERIKESIDVSNHILNIARRNKFNDEIKLLLNPLAVAYTLNAEYDKALVLHFENLTYQESENNFQRQVDILNNIGLVYFKLKNYEKAIDYYEKALEVAINKGKREYADRIYINLGLCYNQIKRFIKAQELIQQGFSECGDKCGDGILIEGEFGLGVAFFGEGDFERSYNHFLKSLEISRKNNDKRFQAENLIYLGRVLAKQSSLQEAQEYFFNTIEISEQSGYKQLLLDSYKELSELYKSLENFEDASLFQTKYIALKDSIIGEQLISNIANIQTQFEERENIKTIALKEEALSRQRMLNLAIGTIAFLAALLVFVLYQSNKVKRRVNIRLSDANAIIAEQNKQLQAHSNILQAEVNKATAELLVANQSLDKVNKELDNFIYKTSHDIRGPLASLKGMCNVALIDVKDDLALNYLSKLDVTATKLNRILTRLLIVNQINNATLNPEPLDMDSIVDDIIRLETKKGLPAEFTFKREIQRNMAIRSDDALIRIILENLIDNAIKFYNDSDRIRPFVLIKIFTDTTYLNIHVIDNGVGISSVHPDRIFQMFTRASEKSGTGGLGLYLIKQSANRLGGDVGLRLTEHGDTEFYVTLPLEIPPHLLEKKEDNKLAPSAKV